MNACIRRINFIMLFESQIFPGKQYSASCRMMRIFLFFILTSLACFPSAYAGEQIISVDPLEQRMKSFEKRIDFDKAIVNHDASEKVVFDWSSIKTPPHLTGWKVVDHRHETTAGPRSREQWEWGYKKDDGGIGITITSHKLGDRTALLAIRNFINKSSLMESPFLKGPSDLGTVSLVLPGPYGYEVYWAYRDLEFSIEATEKDLALKTAYWLTSIAQRHRKPR